MNHEKRFAILIDGENISAGYIKIIMDEISTKGIATYKRIYGDWTKPGLAKWKDILLSYSITPMQQYSYTTGKNASDCAMIIDAMDILYSGKVDGFCLATSDSDFTKLASRLRESGMEVVGMGEEKTPRPFVAACNEFKFVDKLLKESELAAAAERAAAKAEAAQKAKEKKKLLQKEPSTSQTSFSTIRSTIVSLIQDNSDEDGYMLVSDVGSILSKRYADFDVRNYSFKKMVPFLKSMGLFEVRKDPDPKSPNSQIAYVRLKEDK